MKQRDPFQTLGILTQEEIFRIASGAERRKDVETRETIANILALVSDVEYEEVSSDWLALVAEDDKP